MNFRDTDATPVAVAKASFSAAELAATYLTPLDMEITSTNQSDNLTLMHQAQLGIQ